MNKYKFTRNPYNQSGIDDIYGVDYDSLSKEDIGLFEINSETWTPEILQEILDESNKLTGNDNYFYQVEGSDFMISVKKLEVLMWTREGGKPVVTWSFNKFIKFMEAFKKFVAEAK